MTSADVKRRRIATMLARLQGKPAPAPTKLGPGERVEKMLAEWLDAMPLDDRGRKYDPALGRANTGGYGDRHRDSHVRPYVRQKEVFERQVAEEAARETQLQLSRERHARREAQGAAVREEQAKREAEHAARVREKSEMPL